MVFVFFCKQNTAYESRISDWSSDVCSSDLPKPGTSLLRRLLFAANPLAARGIGHRMRFVEDDHAVEVGAQPFDDLVDPARLAFARLTAQRRIKIGRASCR